jgi:signal recognition particle receptor subunit beta
MAIINYANKEVQFKIVFYGPALCGKTSNLAYIHQQVNDTNKGELVSLATAADRTLFFDFLPLNTIVIKGFKTKFQLYTVPGQVIYNATRQLVLRSVDGVVFVADSQWDKMEENIESFKNLQDNLVRQNMSLDTIPYIIQYNKRDMPTTAPVHYLEFILNNRRVRVPTFQAVATNGEGVFATLNAISRLLLQKFARETEAAAAKQKPGMSHANTALSGVAAGGVARPRDHQGQPYRLRR